MVLKQELDQITSENHDIITVVILAGRPIIDIIHQLKNEKFLANDVKDYKVRHTIHTRLDDIIKFLRSTTQEGNTYSRSSYAIFHYGANLMISDKLNHDYHIYYRCDKKFCCVPDWYVIYYLKRVGAAIRLIG